jgi:hypothetical protein
LSDEDPKVKSPLAGCTWYKDNIFLLQKLQPRDGMEKSKVRGLKLKSIKYCLIDQVLYWKDPLRVLLICLDPREAQKIYMIFMIVYLGGITYGEPQPIKFSGLGIFGLASLLMSVKRSGLVLSVRNSLESINSSLCH